MDILNRERYFLAALYLRNIKVDTNLICLINLFITSL